MVEDPGRFYQAALTAGAILSGFIGTFLNFRIQRESSYYRSPGSDATGQQHFTSSFLLIIFSAITSVVFGVVLPLLSLVHGDRFASKPATILAGIVGSLVLTAFYFLDELYHYKIICRMDWVGWKRELWIVIGGILLAALLATITFCAVWCHA